MDKWFLYNDGAILTSEIEGLHIEEHFGGIEDNWEPIGYDVIMATKGGNYYCVMFYKSKEDARKYIKNFMKYLG